MSSTRVLVVDDQAEMRETLDDGLTARGFEVHQAATGTEALEVLVSGTIDVMVTDLRLRGMDGIELCERARSCCPDVPVVLMTGFSSLESAVAAMRAGAFDFITKPVAFDALELALRRAAQHRALRDEVRRLRRAVSEAQHFEEILGESPKMKRLFDLLARVSEADAAVLIVGETGTGKELVAHALHRRGPRAEGPFVSINCSALPPALLESELFGHEKGAFTDAQVRRTGLFVESSGGVIFLDEIGTLPLELQPKLLRCLEGRVVRPVGSNQEVAFDARVVAATNDDLTTAIAAGRFREDLYFRLNVIQINLPPLRERGNDILLLAQQFIERFAERSQKRVTGITSDAAERLLAYAWPGNVRELANCIERGVALTRYERLTVDDLPESIRQHSGPGPATESERSDEFLPLEEVERRHILRVLDAFGGNKAEVARVLKVGRRTLYRKLDLYGVHTRDEDE